MVKRTKPKGRPDRVVSGVTEERKRIQGDLRAAVRRERDIDRLAKKLRRLVDRNNTATFDFAQKLIGADYRIVPATSPAAAAQS